MPRARGNWCARAFRLILSDVGCRGKSGWSCLKISRKLASTAHRADFGTSEYRNGGKATRLGATGISGKARATRQAAAHCRKCAELFAAGKRKPAIGQRMCKHETGRLRPAMKKMMARANRGGERNPVCILGGTEQGQDVGARAIMRSHAGKMRHTSE